MPGNLTTSDPGAAGSVAGIAPGVGGATQPIAGNITGTPGNPNAAAAAQAFFGGFVSGYGGYSGGLAGHGELPPKPALSPMNGPKQLIRLYPNAYPITVGVRNVTTNGHTETVSAPLITEYTWPGNFGGHDVYQQRSSSVMVDRGPRIEPAPHIAPAPPREQNSRRAR